jgi:hypothetical protein
VRGFHAQHRLGGDLIGEFSDHYIIGGYLTGGDCGLRLGATREQAALYEPTIDANA